MITIDQYLELHKALCPYGCRPGRTRVPARCMEAVQRAYKAYVAMATTTKNGGDK
jgi:hypothetical protein